MVANRIYREARLIEFGVTLEEFKADPSSVLRQCGQQSAFTCIKNGFRPLLPKQVLIARRIQQEWADEDLKKKAAERQSGQLRDAAVSDLSWLDPLMSH